MKDEKPGGHGERCGAVGLIDAALWDLAAKSVDEPLWRLLARHHGPPNAGAKIELYASGGHYRAANDIEALCDDVRRAIGQGHRRFKIKIGGADARRRSASGSKRCLAFSRPDMSLAVDGNGTFDRERRSSISKRLAPIRWPGSKSRCIRSISIFIARSPRMSDLPLATGENMFSPDDARNLLRYGGLRKDRDMLQFDISLSYGIVEYLRILDRTRRARLEPRALRAACRSSARDAGGRRPGARTRRSRNGYVDDCSASLTADVAGQRRPGELPDAPGAGFETPPVFAQLFGGLLN